MANLHIRREHALTLAAARKIARAWIAEVESEFGMACTYTEGAKEDRVHFTRTGVNGELVVTADHFDLDAKLGFLLGAFKGKIEAEIVKNLDDLLAPKAAAKKTSKAHKPKAP
ncbi:MAG: polyhydroxyalkanoic acid system family protein [Rhodoferax sp.]